MVFIRASLAQEVYSVLGQLSIGHCLSDSLFLVVQHSGRFPAAYNRLFSGVDHNLVQGMCQTQLCGATCGFSSIGLWVESLLFLLWLPGPLRGLSRFSPALS